MRIWPLPYVDRLDARSVGSILMVVIHCTELPDLSTARDYAERVLYGGTQTGNSGHYYIDRDGSITEFVPIDRVAHHVRGHNAESIGIELVNLGRYPDWLDSRTQLPKEPFTDEQIDALLRLLDDLRQRAPGLTKIAGHEDLDLEQVEASDDARLRVYRKRDPGPLFPWDTVISRSGLQRVPRPSAP